MQKWRFLHQKLIAGLHYAVLAFFFFRSEIFLLYLISVSHQHETNNLYVHNKPRDLLVTSCRTLVTEPWEHFKQADPFWYRLTCILSVLIGFSMSRIQAMQWAKDSHLFIKAAALGVKRSGFFFCFGEVQFLGCSCDTLELQVQVEHQNQSGRSESESSPSSGSVSGTSIAHSRTSHTRIYRKSVTFGRGLFWRWLFDFLLIP